MNRAQQEELAVDTAVKSAGSSLAPTWSIYLLRLDLSLQFWFKEYLVK